MITPIACFGKFTKARCKKSTLKCIHCSENSLAPCLTFFTFDDIWNVRLPPLMLQLQEKFGQEDSVKQYRILGESVFKGLSLQWMVRI